MKYTLKTQKLNFTNGEITLRGLTVPDISQLVSVHQSSAVSIYEKFTGSNAVNLTEQSVESVALDIITQFPSIVAHLIYLCDSERETNAELSDYQSLPIDVQVSALEVVAGLTFAMEGGVKNFAETVIRIAASAAGLTKELRAPQA